MAADMIRRLLATVATSAILVAAAMVALEATGLLFQKGTPEPVIANIHVREVPEETAPALVWKRQEELELARLKGAQEEVRLEAERLEAARQTEDEERRLADALRWAEAYRRGREGGQKVAALSPPPVVDAPAVAEPRPVPPQTRDPKLTPAAAGPARETPTTHRPSARPGRAGPVRGGAVRRISAGCPFLGWLQAVVAPPPPRRGAT
jgi:hypothetical protein